MRVLQTILLKILWSRVQIFAFAFVAVATIAQDCCAQTYEHRTWQFSGLRGVNDDMARSEMQRVRQFNYPVEGVSVKYSDSWVAFAPGNGVVVKFDGKVAGRLTIAPSSNLKLDQLVKAQQDYVRSQLAKSGGKLISITAKPQPFCDLPGYLIEQKFSYADLREPIYCNTYLAQGKNAVYTLELAVQRPLYENKLYKEMLDNVAASVRVSAPGVRVTRLKVSCQEVERIASDALSHLTEVNDFARQFSYKYPSSWEVNKPFALSAGDTAILFTSPSKLIRGGITAKKPYLGQNLDTVAADYIKYHTQPTVTGQFESKLLRNDAVTIDGHAGRCVVLRSAYRQVLSDPFQIYCDYVVIANGKIYELDLNVPEPAYERVQKLFEAMASSLKF